MKMASDPLGSMFAMNAPPRTAKVAVLVRNVTASSCLLSLPPT